MVTELSASPQPSESVAATKVVKVESPVVVQSTGKPSESQPQTDSDPELKEAIRAWAAWGDFEAKKEVIFGLTQKLLTTLRHHRRHLSEDEYREKVKKDVVPLLLFPDRQPLRSWADVFGSEDAGRLFPSSTDREDRNYRLVQAVFSDPEVQALIPSDLMVESINQELDIGGDKPWRMMMLLVAESMMATQFFFSPEQINQPSGAKTVLMREQLNPLTYALTKWFMQNDEQAFFKLQYDSDALRVVMAYADIYGFLDLSTPDGRERLMRLDYAAVNMPWYRDHRALPKVAFDSGAFQNTQSHYLKSLKRVPQKVDEHLRAKKTEAELVSPGYSADYEAREKHQAELGRSNLESFRTRRNLRQTLTMLWQHYLGQEWGLVERALKPQPKTGEKSATQPAMLAMLEIEKCLQRERDSFHSIFLRLERILAEQSKLMFSHKIENRTRRTAVTMLLVESCYLIAVENARAGDAGRLNRIYGQFLERYGEKLDNLCDIDPFANSQVEPKKLGAFDTADYERRLAHAHQVLRASPSAGFIDAEMMENYAVYETRVRAITQIMNQMRQLTTDSYQEKRFQKTGDYLDYYHWKQLPEFSRFASWPFLRLLLPAMITTLSSPIVIGDEYSESLSKPVPNILLGISLAIVITSGYFLFLERKRKERYMDLDVSMVDELRRVKIEDADADEMLARVAQAAATAQETLIAGGDRRDFLRFFSEQLIAITAIIAVITALYWMGTQDNLFELEDAPKLANVLGVGEAEDKGVKPEQEEGSFGDETLGESGSTSVESLSATLNIENKDFVSPPPSILLNYRGSERPRFAGGNVCTVRPDQPRLECSVGEQLPPELAAMRVVEADDMTEFSSRVESYVSQGFLVQQVGQKNTFFEPIAQTIPYQLVVFRGDGASGSLGVQVWESGLVAIEGEFYRAALVSQVTDEQSSVLPMTVPASESPNLDWESIATDPELQNFNELVAFVRGLLEMRAPYLADRNPEDIQEELRAASGSRSWLSNREILDQVTLWLSSRGYSYGFGTFNLNEHATYDSALRDLLAQSHLDCDSWSLLSMLAVRGAQTGQLDPSFPVYLRSGFAIDRTSYPSGWIGNQGHVVQLYQEVDGEWYVYETTLPEAENQAEVVANDHNLELLIGALVSAGLSGSALLGVFGYVARERFKRGKRQPSRRRQRPIIDARARSVTRVTGEDLPDDHDPKVTPQEAELVYGETQVEQESPPVQLPDEVSKQILRLANLVESVSLETKPVVSRTLEELSSWLHLNHADWQTMRTISGQPDLTKIVAVAYSSIMESVRRVDPHNFKIRDHGLRDHYQSLTRRYLVEPSRPWADVIARVAPKVEQSKTVLNDPEWLQLVGQAVWELKQQLHQTEEQLVAELNLGAVDATEQTGVATENVTEQLKLALVTAQHDDREAPTKALMALKVRAAADLCQALLDWLEAEWTARGFTQ